MRADIDPHAWLVMLPVTAALIWLYFQPHAHPVKQAWRTLMDFEAQAWAFLTGQTVNLDDPRRRRLDLMLFWSATAASAAGSTFSLAVSLGWLVL